jgi:hypothetical protein
MASGDTLVVFTPLANEPPATAYATLDLRNNHPVLDFDAATNEVAMFTGIMPRSYSNATGITVYLHWAASTDTNPAHECHWWLALERLSENGTHLDADSFGSDEELAGNPNANSGKTTTTNVGILKGAPMSNIVGGDPFRLRITRAGTVDDMTGDAELLGVEIKET